MPGTPGSRLTGGAPHVSDAQFTCRRDTPTPGSAEFEAQTASSRLLPASLCRPQGLSVAVPIFGIRPRRKDRP